MWFHVGEGAEKGALLSVDCRGGLRKIIWRKEGSFGCLTKIVSKKTVPIRRSLRKIVTSSPPPPLKNPHLSHGGYAPPPLIAWWWLSTLIILSMFVDHSFEIYCFNLLPHCKSNIWLWRRLSPTSSSCWALGVDGR